MNYSPKAIEEKWNERWRKEGIYEPDFLRPRGKGGFYNLMMFPYPSAEGLHIGSVRTFTGVDIYGRFKRMQGYDVFEPIGLDGFGIHSENYALKIGEHPAKLAGVTEKNFYRQLAAIGNGFAWEEKLETYDPAYYRWTQWIFIQLFKRGLAYRKKSAVNWCPSCLTVLADEQVIAGKCERCGTDVIKKDLEQWFFKITEYAERLLQNLGKLDWSDVVRIAQKNWIGRSEGASIRFSLTGIPGQPDAKHSVEVFTTRPDTLFGATFLAISPELAKTWIDVGWQASDAVRQYVTEALAKRVRSEDETTKEKTGVPSGIFAINPANQEKIPVWVSDYVLAGYGTGAIMAVPAHDERDFEFSKKFNLPIKKVIAGEFGDRRPNEEFRDGGAGIVFDPLSQKYAVARWNDDGRVTLFAGGVGQNETAYEATVREVKEESGFHKFLHVEWVDVAYAHYFNKAKNVNRFARAECLLFILDSTDRRPVALEDHEDFELVWLSPDEILFEWEKRNAGGGYSHYMEFLREGVSRAIELGYDKTSNCEKYTAKAFAGYGFLENSDKFSGHPSEEAKWEITKFVQGERKVQYRLRDWLISRQRYWGPPIPMIFCEACRGKGIGDRPDMAGWYTVPEKDLPVELPYVEEFRPTGTGKSPLASVKSFYDVLCPACGKTARRETDVSDTFLDSAWYFLRYPSISLDSARDKRSGQVPWDPEITKKWLPVHMYIGGAEHSVLHLLYSRFITMAFHDIGLLEFEEPFTTFRAHGLITKDGAKMSKSKGNVVNPDEYLNAYGADAMRMYLAFLAPLTEGGDFRDSGIRGVTRFLERVWKFFHGRSFSSNVPELGAPMHQAIQAISRDIENLQYNTAISALMTLLHILEERADDVSREDAKLFLQLLAPFAPFITEELWHELGETASIHRSAWPEADERYLKKTSFVIPIQIAGKVRDRVEVDAGASEEAVQALVLERPKVQEWTREKSIRQLVYVPGKIVNIVF